MELETGYLCPFSSTCMNMWSLYSWSIVTEVALHVPNSTSHILLKYKIDVIFIDCINFFLHSIQFFL
jgi:hypothetical protein